MALPMMPNVAKRASVKFVNADGTTTQTLLTCAANGGFIEAMHIAGIHNTSGGIWLTFWISDGTTHHYLGRFLLPETTTPVPIPVVNVLDPGVLTYLNQASVQYRLGGGDQIRVRCETAVPAGSYEISVTAQYGEYPTS